MSASNDLDTFLNDLLKCLATGDSLHQGQCSHLTTLFIPSVDAHVRAKAFVALSAVTEHYRHLNTANDEDAGTHNIVHAYQSTVDSKISEVDEKPLVEVLSFITALTAVDWKAGTAFVLRDGFQDAMMDALELFPTSHDVRLVIAALLAAACGYKSCRAGLSSRCLPWLDIAVQDPDAKIKATACLALLKLSQGHASDDGSVAQLANSSNEEGSRQSRLFSNFRDALIVSDDQLSSVMEVIEGLAYISTNSLFKEQISKDTILLQKLFGLSKALQKRHARQEELGTAPFGLASLVANLATYRPKLSGEQAQIQKLKEMAQAKVPGRGQGSSEDFDTDDHVRARAKRLVDAGAAELLVAIVQVAESDATRAVIGRGFIGLIEDKANRGRILQAGGAKAIMSIIRASQRNDPKSNDHLSKADINFTDMLAIQALAKLAITSSPLQVFGPSENASIDAIKPLVCLLLHATSTLLQRFEALMALTNISSASPDLAERVSSTEGVLNKLEFLLLDDNTMVRRAATELVCNLVSGSEYAFNRCTGDDSSASDSQSSDNQAKSRLHILFALSDVDDEPTRLAASGALAVLTGSPNACSLITKLELEHHRVFPVLRRLLSPSSEAEGDECEVPQNAQGLMHRGVVCVRNLLYNTAAEDQKKRLLAEAVRHGFIDALAIIIKDGQSSLSADILQPTAEALKWLVENGADLLLQ